MKFIFHFILFYFFILKEMTNPQIPKSKNPQIHKSTNPQICLLLIFIDRTYN
jgi:hypothetical protein